MQVQIYLEDGVVCPEYSTAGSAGMDLRANISEPVTIGSLERVLVPTGVFMSIEQLHESMIRPRSGLAWKHGVTVLNTPGTVDEDYRGEVKIILVNLSKEPYTVQPKERIAQMVFNKYAKAEIVLVDSVEAFTVTERGDGGFGHTGNE